MSKLGPSIVLTDPSEIMSSQAMSHINSMAGKKIGDLSIMYRTMGVNELVSLTEFITNGANIKNLNIKLTEHPGEQGFALNVFKLARSILDSHSISECSLYVDAFAFDLNCKNKAALASDFALLPDENSLEEFSQNEGVALDPAFADDELLDEDSELLAMVGDVANAALLLPEQVQNGVFSMYALACQGLSKLTLGNTVGALPCVVTPCFDGEEERERIEKKLK